MKKMYLVLFAIVAMGLASCGGGGKSSSQVPVNLDVLDDYFTVKSCKLETNVAEKGLEHIADAKGALTLVLTVPLFCVNVWVETVCTPSLQFRISRLTTHTASALQCQRRDRRWCVRRWPCR